MRLLLLALLAAGCTAKEDWDNGGATANGSCQPQAENALRFDCDLTAGADATVVVTLDGPEGALVRSGGPTQTLAGLRPYQVSSSSGHVATRTSSVVVSSPSTVSMRTGPTARQYMCCPRRLSTASTSDAPPLGSAGR